jgi:hypothetical protein
MYITRIRFTSRVPVVAALLLSATLAFGQDTNPNCHCPNADVIEERACIPTKTCSGDYVVTGCDTIHRQDNCLQCTFTNQTCCATKFKDYQNNGLCGLANKQIAMMREDKDLMSGEIDMQRIFVPVCRGTYMSLDQVLGSNDSDAMSHAYIGEH